MSMWGNERLAGLRIKCVGARQYDMGFCNSLLDQVTLH